MRYCVDKFAEACVIHFDVNLLGCLQEGAQGFGENDKGFATDTARAILEIPGVTSVLPGRHRCRVGIGRLLNSQYIVSRIVRLVAKALGRFREDHSRGRERLGINAQEETDAGPTYCE